MGCVWFFGGVTVMVFEQECVNVNVKRSFLGGLMGREIDWLVGLVCWVR